MHEVCKLEVDNPNLKVEVTVSDLNPEKIETNDQTLISKTAKDHFQAIYTDQHKVQGSVQELEDFLIMGEDTLP